MRTWIRARLPVLAAVAVLVLGAVAAVLYVSLRPDAAPPVSAPSITSGSPAPTTVGGTTTTTATTTTTTSWATTTIPAGQPFPESLRGQDISRLPTDDEVVALTFDAGGDSAGLPAILRTLAAEHVRATFFITGDFALNDPDHVQAILAAGHRVGNHSMTHPSMTLLSDDQIADEVQRAQQALQHAGADPRPLFRFPFGDRDARTIAAVNAQGYLAVRWTVDTLGWQGTSGGATARRVTERTVETLQPGEIVLMHVGANPDDGSTLDADALPDVIAAVRAHGYGFATLDAVLGA
jgi:peptidoglycan/xylan/chitin deacetylase (PgdA/CDA1 family)